MTAVMKNQAQARVTPASVGVDGPLLAAYLRRSGLSQAAVARKVSCSRQMIHLLATGKRTSCTPSMVAAIERALGLGVGTLVNLSGGGK